MDEPFEIRQRRLPGARFEEVDLSGATFRQVSLAGATVRGADASDLDVREVWFGGARFRGVILERVAIDGEIGEDVTVNGVLVKPLIEAELDRLHPERLRLRPTTPEGFGEAWTLVEELWAGTVERARRLDPSLLHERVDDEWSFVETLRHLGFATESWLLKVVQGDSAPWHPLSLPPEEGGDTEVVPCDRSARPSLDEALDYRHDRMAAVRRFVDQLTAEQLAGRTTPVEAPGGPRPDSYPVAQALQVILDEEWWHRQFALRDLAVLEQRGATA
jgi:hypothetical protein